MNRFILITLLPTTSLYLHYLVGLIYAIVIKRQQIGQLALPVIASIIVLIVCALYLMDINPIRYAFFPCIILLGYYSNKHDLSHLIIPAIIVNFVWVLMENIAPTSSLRLVFRSSLVDYHLERSSGVFNYPGDLGHFCVVAIFSVLYFMRKSLLPPRIGIFYMSLCILMLFESQSRMAFIQLFVCISLLLLTLNLRVSHIITFTVISALLFYHLDLSYLFKVDINEMFAALLVLDGEKFKRFADLNLLRHAIFLPSELPTNITFVEVGFVRQSFNLGIFLSSILSLAFVISLTIRMFRCRTASLLPIIIAALSLVIFNLIGAPLDRPKLNFFTLFIVGYAYRKKNSERLL